MKLWNLLVDLYQLVIHAIAIALADPDFAAKVAEIEADIEALGVDIPGFEPPAPPAEPAAPPAEPAQTARRAAPPAEPAKTGLVDNGDGTFSLNE